MPENPPTAVPRAPSPVASEVLILPDGRVLGHQLTPEVTALLATLNPDDPQFRPRAAKARAVQSASPTPSPVQP